MDNIKLNRGTKIKTERIENYEVKKIIGSITGSNADDRQYFRSCFCRKHTGNQRHCRIGAKC